MMRINIFYRTGKTKEGKSYTVPYTLDFGYNLTIQLNGNLKAQTDPTGQDYVVYDPMKAGLKVNERGYLTLNIID